MKFKVGDRVRIRQWDDMKKEFGTVSWGVINCSNAFTEGMRELCGKKATISHIYGAFSKNVSLKDFENCEGIDTNWCYSTDMLEPVLTGEEKQYLEAVLMPFKNRVLYVEKAIYDVNRAFLRIRIKSILGENSQESILLPYFNPEKMYVGMEETRRYTIEELGLFEGEEEDGEKKQ